MGNGDAIGTRELERRASGAVEIDTVEIDTVEIDTEINPVSCAARATGHSTYTTSKNRR